MSILGHMAGGRRKYGAGWNIAPSPSDDVGVCAAWLFCEKQEMAMMTTTQAGVLLKSFFFMTSLIVIRRVEPIMQGNLKKQCIGWQKTGANIFLRNYLP